MPAVLFWILAVWAAASRGPLFVYLPWLFLPFGALAMISPEITFGSTVLPSSAAMALFIVKVFVDRRNHRALLDGATQLRALGMLGLYTLYTIVGAIVLPRLFEGKVQVIGIRQADDELYALMPSTANFTQSAYTLLSFLFCAAMVAYLRGAEPEKRLQNVLRGMYLGGAVLAITGLIGWIGGMGVLEAFRTASYVTFGYTEVGGAGRITGAFAEASTFGQAAVFEATFLVLALPALEEGLLRRVYAPLIALLLFLLAAASTASTAYAGLVIFVFWLVLTGLKQFAVGRMSATVPVLLVMGTALVAVSVTVIWFPKAVDAIQTLLSATVTEKTNSISYRQRQFWNQTAMAAFEASSGWGIGPGTQRASSWPLVILSNIGVPGALTMGLFLIFSFLRAPPDRPASSRTLIVAGKIALLTTVGMTALAGTILDPGLSIAFLSGIVLACSRWRGNESRGVLRNWMRREGRTDRSVAKP